jgi:hypothetical protein
MSEEPTNSTVITVEEIRVLLNEVARLKAENARLRGLPADDWRAPMMAVVDDQMMRDIVREQSRSVHLPSPPASQGVVQVGSGWVNPLPLSKSVPGVEMIDRVAEGFAQREKAEAVAKQREVAAALAKPFGD